MQTFIKVTARLMAPGVLSGAILSWITCINELSSSVMLYGGKTSTISVAIYTEVVNSFGTAAAWHRCKYSYFPAYLPEGCKVSV